MRLGPLEIDTDLVRKQLRQDLKDDWFPDPRKFDDVFDSNLIEEIITKNFEHNHGAYLPSEKSPLNIPKPNFTIRSALEVSVTDRVIYHALCSALVPLVDPLMPWQVLSHRFNTTDSSDRYLFKRGVSAWIDFIQLVRSQLRPNLDEPQNRALLSTDLTNYYDHINVKILRTRLEDLIPHIEGSAEVKADARARIDALFRCLESWTLKPDQGLPQNRDASSFLANVYMLEVDRAMLAKGYMYFRYMDDIKVVCDDVYDARKALKDLSVELRKIGLSVNSKKTQICEPSESEKIDSCLDSFKPDLLELSSIWQTRRTEVISRAFGKLRDLTEKLLRDDSVDSREFRFCISRLELLATCDEFSVPPSYFDPITPLVIRALDRAPAASDQLVSYLRAVALDEGNLLAIAEQIRHPKRNIYSWQNYRIWLLLATKKFLHEDLVECAKSIVLEGADNPTRSGATIYLGVLGGLDGRLLIADRFATLKSFMGQRSALIAMHELNYRDHIVERVAPHVRPDLVGAWRELKKGGLYFSPPERRSIRWIVEGERDYE